MKLDPLRTSGVLAIAAVAYFLRSAGPKVGLGIILAAAVLASTAVTWQVKESRRQRIMVWALAGTFIGTFAAIPWTRPWAGAWVACLLAVGAIVGHVALRGEDTRKKLTTARALKLINDQIEAAMGDVLPPGTKAIGITPTTRGARLTLRTPAQFVNKLDAAKLRNTISAQLHRPHRLTEITMDMTHSNVVHLEVLREPAFTDRLDRPDTFNPDRLPLGYDAHMLPVAMDLTTTRSPHILIGGMTGSGKTTTLAGIIGHHLTCGDEVWLLDPKGEGLDEFFPTSAYARWAEGPDACRQALLDAERIMNGRRKHHNPTRLILAIDEAEPVLGEVPAADRAYQLILTGGRTKDVRIVTAIQSARNLTMSGKAKAQHGTVLAHGVANDIEDRILLGPKAPTCVGLPQGRAWVRSEVIGDDRRGFQLVQMYPAKGLPVARQTDSTIKQGIYGQPGQPLPSVARPVAPVAPRLPDTRVLGAHGQRLLCELHPPSGDRPMTTKALEDLTGINRGTIGKTLARLADAGLVVKDGATWRRAS